MAFRAEIHVNDFFYFLKIIFDISTSKRSKKYKPHSILAKKKNSKFDETQLQTQYQTLPNDQRNIGLVLGCFMTWLEKEKYCFLKIKLLTL
jgi:hypothetical protein